jgi:hypothetical protein
MYPDSEQVRTSRIAHADLKIPREYDGIVFLKHEGI